jgi:outer membrane lipase/esterase
MPRTGTSALAVAALSLAAIGVPARATPQLFVLGDSLSDVGNAAGAADYLLGAVGSTPVGLCNLADLLLPRRCDDVFYRQSRVSDGPVAVEHLAAHLGAGPLVPSLHVVPARAKSATAYAVASAKARAQGDADLGRQLDWLLLDHAPLPADAVYVVMIGGNDAIDALQADVAAPVADPRPSAQIVSAAVAAIGLTVERLLDFGARRVVVANVPDLGALPAIRTAAELRPDADAVVAHASAISSAFDAELHATLDALQARRHPWLPAAAIVRFDLRAALMRAQQNALAEGRNAYDACFDSAAYGASGTAERTFNPACAPSAAGDSPRFSNFVFWDGIHPTGAAHAELGASLSACLEALSTAQQPGDVVEAGALCHVGSR